MRSIWKYLWSQVKQTMQLREVGGHCTHSTKHCPVAMLGRYFKLASITGEQDKFLSRGLTTTKNGSSLRSAFLVGGGGWC